MFDVWRRAIRLCAKRVNLINWVNCGGAVWANLQINKGIRLSQEDQSAHFQIESEVKSRGHAFG